MKIITQRIISCLALALLAACGTFQASDQSGACTPVEPPDCPVCPVEEPAQCPEPQVIEKVVAAPAPPRATTAGKQHLPIIGAVEWATVEPGNIRLEARVDTGAETSSIHAEDIALVEKDGKRYVRFILPDPASGKRIQMEERLRRRVAIKQSEDEADRRYVVKLWISVGQARTRIDVTLTDRDYLEYPLLLGRNFLVDTMIVDVSQQHVSAN